MILPEKSSGISLSCQTLRRSPSCPLFRRSSTCSLCHFHIPTLSEHSSSIPASEKSASHGKLHGDTLSDHNPSVGITQIRYGRRSIFLSACHTSSRWLFSFLFFNIAHPCFIVKLLLFRNRVDQTQFLSCKRRTVDSLHIINDLLRFGCSDEHAGDFLMLEQPAKCHVCKFLASLCCQIVQSPDLVQTLRCQGAFFQESSVPADSAVLRNTVQVTVCQLSLSKRAESDQAFFQDAGSSL